MIDSILPLAISSVIANLPSVDKANEETIRNLVMSVVVNSEKILACEKIISVCKRLYRKSFFEGTSGNVSVRLSDGSILITPSAVSKDSLICSDIVRTDINGVVIEGNRKPSSEIKMHLAVYKNRPDIHSVIHAHPPFSVAFCAVDTKINTTLLAEAMLILGEVPVVKYATPSTEEVPDFLVPYLNAHNAFLLANHGLLTFGSDLEQALTRAETLEFTAKVTAIAKGLGGRMVYLSGAQVAHLFATH